MTITIYRDQLLYDIGNNAYIEGHKAESHGSPTEETHLTMDVCHSGNIDRVDRVLAAAYYAAIDILHPLCVAATDERYDNRQWTPAVYLFEIRTPPDMQAGTINRLALLIHEYMTARALSDWLSITDPTSSVKWADKTALCANEIRGIITAGSYRHPTVRKLSPF